MRLSKYLLLLENAIRKLEEQELSSAISLIEEAGNTLFNPKKVISAIALGDTRVAIDSIRAEIRDWEEMRRYDD